MIRGFLATSIITREVQRSYLVNVIDNPNRIGNIGEGTGCKRLQLRTYAFHGKQRKQSRKHSENDYEENGS